MRRKKGEYGDNHKIDGGKNRKIDGSENRVDRPALPPSLEQIRASLTGFTPKPVGDHRYYSVLIPLIKRKDALSILYEVRSTNLRRQPGEISFPGGKIEPGETPEDCAVRETAEELRLPPDAVEIISPLNYIITYSNFTMYAFLGQIDADALDAATPNPEEVGRIFEVPLQFFWENEPDLYVNQIHPVIAQDFPLEKIHFQKGYSWRTGEAAVPIYTYRDADSAEEFVIWGLTARLTQDFIETICARISYI
jgi:8-oxo-dGTP pyrophosphatase MutT (NUDIX family)